MVQKNSDCSVVKDLLPLYREQLLSETSKTFVEQHMETCEICREYDKSLQGSIEESERVREKNENRLFHSLKRMRYEILGLMCGLLTVVVLVIGLLSYAIHQPGKTVSEHYENVQEYGMQNYRGISKLSMFPEKDKIDGTIIDFYYDCEGTALYQNYQIFLKCEYEQQDYNRETERLLELTDETTGLTTVFSETENEMPCIYAMLYDEGFEYALLDNDNCVIYYIYLQGIDKRDLYFSEDYLPVAYGQKGLSFETEREPYRIYPRE